VAPSGHGLRPTALRRRASRPQLKRDPLGGAYQRLGFDMTYPVRPPHVIIADRFANLGTGPDRLRLELASGEELDARKPFFDSEQLILYTTLPDRTVREVRPAEITAMWEPRPNWRTRSALGASIVVLGAVIGGLVGGSGMFLGALAGAFAAPVAIWLLQDLAPFVSWREVLAEGRRLTSA